MIDELQGVHLNLVKQRGHANENSLRLITLENDKSATRPQRDVALTKSKVRSLKNRDKLCREHISKFLSNETDTQGDDFEWCQAILEENLANLTLERDDDQVLSEKKASTCFIPSNLVGTSDMVAK